MIVLLSYSTSWSKNNEGISSTGGLDASLAPPDSVLIAVSDLRVATAKMLELKYEKEINEKLRTVVANDSIAINSLRQMVDRASDEKKVLRTQRNIFQGTTIVSVILLIISLF